MIKSLIVTGLTLLLMFQVSSAQEYREVTKDNALKFPGDYYYRPDYRVQWWYFTGHLFDKEGHEFGYELTFFVLGVQKRDFKSRFGVKDIYVSHFAVTDPAKKKYIFSERSDSGAYGFAGAEKDRLRVWVGGNEMQGTSKKILLKASGEGLDLALELSALKPEILHGEKGYSRKSAESPLIASHYFSVTDLATEGRLKIGDRVIAVKGKSWFDREISSGRRGQGLKGWDWFGMQLDDGREIMLYHLRNVDGTTDRYSSGTLVLRDGSSRHLTIDDFSITVLRHYRSTKTGARYPSAWTIRIPEESLSLTVTPLLEDQEFIATYSTGNYYWEGSCNVKGSTTGRAYAEMTGY